MPVPLTSATILDACDHARSLDRSRYEALDDLARAEALQASIAIARLARGERPVGYKIGFTNRSIWPLYGVFHPIWAPVWNATLIRAAGGLPTADPGAGEPLAGGAAPAPVTLAAARFVEPRIEPEIVVALREAPAADTPEAVLAAADWIAHGLEIVQSPFPGWRFSAAEAFAAQALHGALVLGPAQPVSMLGAPAAQALARLGALEVELLCDGRLVERGRGANALDGPMHAVAHLSRELRRRGRSIEPGSLVSTGTLTDAQPIGPGQRWETRLRGLDLPGLALDVR
ncbi:MAG: fumarylacetoacetate hydrolase family protein [Burkholderiaceae bacterium]|nr:fumarylacetoacetate hydrolase family protein [Burkholderiaceae bacterium]